MGLLYPYTIFNSMRRNHIISLSGLFGRRSRCDRGRVVYMSCVEAILFFMTRRMSFCLVSSLYCPHSFLH